MAKNISLHCLYHLIWYIYSIQVPKAEQTVNWDACKFLVKLDKIKILALICFNSLWLVNGCTFFFLFSMVEVVKLFVFTECYELSIVRNDTPIYKAIVYIKVNVEICTHVSPWLNFSNTEVGTSNPSDVYVSVQRFAYPHIIWGLDVKETLPLCMLKNQILRISQILKCHYMWTIVFYSLCTFKPVRTPSPGKTHVLLCLMKNRRSEHFRTFHTIKNWYYFNASHCIRQVYRKAFGREENI